MATTVATAPIHAVAAAAGLIAQGEDDGRVVIRDVRTLKVIGRVLSLGPYPATDRGADMAVGRQVTGVAPTPDGSAVVAGDLLGHLRMWSLPERQLLWSRDDVPASRLAVSPDGRYLATAGNRFAGAPMLPPWSNSALWEDPNPDWNLMTDSRLLTSEFRVWDLSTHTVQLSEDLNDWQYRPTPMSVVFSPDGGTVAAAYLQGFLMTYDVAQGRRASLVKNFLTAVSSLAFSPDGQRLLAASPDEIKVANATSGKELSVTPLPGLRAGNQMAFTDDGRWLVVSHPRSLTVLDPVTRSAVDEVSLPTLGATDAFAVASGPDHHLIVGTNSQLVSIDMNPDRWKSAACATVARQLTEDEWDRFLPSIPYAPACG